MYKYSKKTLLLNYVYVAIMLFLAIFVQVDIMYRVGVGVIGLLIFKDSFREKEASFDLAGDKIVVKRKDVVVKEIMFKSIFYITITRRNKRWVVIANDDGILFTIKPKIENYEEMVSNLLDLTKSNRKIEVHDYINKIYRKNT